MNGVRIASFSAAVTGAVDAGGKNDADVESGRAVRDQPPDEKIYDLPAGRLPRRVRDDDKNGFAGLDDLFERLRIDGCVELFADLGVGKGRLKLPVAARTSKPAGSYSKRSFVCPYLRSISDIF